MNLTDPEKYIGRHCWASVHTKWGWQRKEFLIDKGLCEGFKKGLVKDIEIE